jgi:fumarate hydratase class II
LRSIRLLSDSCYSFVDKCIDGIIPNEKQINEYVKRCLMLVTALNPVIGYDKASKVAKKAHNEGTTLKEACLSLGYLTEEEFDKYLVPKDMLKPKKFVKSKL